MHHSMNAVCEFKPTGVSVFNRIIVHIMETRPTSYRMHHLYFSLSHSFTGLYSSACRTAQCLRRCGTRSRRRSSFAPSAFQNNGMGRKRNYSRVFVPLNGNRQKKTLGQKSEFLVIDADCLRRHCAVLG